MTIWNPTRRIIASVIVLATTAVMWTATTRAQFVVFDPSNYEEAVRAFLQLQQQYAQLVATYHFMEQQARRVAGDLEGRYRNIATPYLNVVASDTYSANAPWVYTANTGWLATEGYAASTNTLRTYGDALDRLPADEQQRIKNTYSTLELADGLNVHGLQMLGYLRRHSTDVELALRRLEDDSFSGDPDLNTQIAVLNKINAATVSSARMTKDTNQILIAILETQLADAKRRREAETVAINAHIAFQADARDLMQQSAAGTANALATFRLP
jgi:hypothetical protein